MAAPRWAASWEGDIRMSVDNDAHTIDVQPHPRLLSVLGGIEFAPWRCIAELVDNSFNEFLRHPSDGSTPDGEPPTVWVSLPAKTSTARDAEVWVRDNGPGMALEQLNSALRAGWSSNDRHGQLGLYGVGFNIATARLGFTAVVRTARAEDPVWTVVTLDLRALAKGNHFNLPVTTVGLLDPSIPFSMTCIDLTKCQVAPWVADGPVSSNGYAAINASLDLDVFETFTP